MAKKKTSTTKSGSTFDAPQSRNEAILQNILGANNVLGEPQSRIEALLMQILEQGGGGGGGLSDSAKAALITLLEKVAYIDDNGQQYIDDLEDALYNRTLTSISAVFTQGGAIITPEMPLDDLRQYLVVTANYSDNSTITVTDYTLSGTLTVGTSTVTAAWKSKTSSFNVIVSDSLVISNTLTLDGIKNTTSGHNAATTTWYDLSGNSNNFAKLSSAGNVAWGSDHAEFNATNKILQLNGTDILSGLTSFSIEMVIAITGNGSDAISGSMRGMILLGGKVGGHNIRIESIDTNGVRCSLGTVGLDIISVSKDVIEYVVLVCENNEVKAYLNGSLVSTTSISLPLSSKTVYSIGGDGGAATPKYFFNGNIYRMAISSTALSAADITDRYLKAKARFDF